MIKYYTTLACIAMRAALFVGFEPMHDYPGRIAMYHALVRIDGRWTSFGLHNPSNHWTNIFKTLEGAYGEDNVAYTHWAGDKEVKDIEILRRQLLKEVADANAVQEGRDSGRLPVLDEDHRPLSLAYGIAHLNDPIKV
jgi:hypothetical protein